MIVATDASICFAPMCVNCKRPTVEQPCHRCFKFGRLQMPRNSIAFFISPSASQPPLEHFSFSIGHEDSVCKFLAEGRAEILKENRTPSFVVLGALAAVLFKEECESWARRMNQPAPVFTKSGGVAPCLFMGIPIWM